MRYQQNLAGRKIAIAIAMNAGKLRVTFLTSTVLLTTSIGAFAAHRMVNLGDPVCISIAVVRPVREP